MQFHQNVGAAILVENDLFRALIIKKNCYLFVLRYANLLYNAEIINELQATSIMQIRLALRNISIGISLMQLEVCLDKD